MMFAGSVWSTTNATDIGLGSTLNTLSGSRTLFSNTVKSRQVSPATGLPLGSFTVTGTTTSVVCETKVAFTAPMPSAGATSCVFAGGGVTAGGMLEAGGAVCAGGCGPAFEPWFEEDPDEPAGVSPAPIPGVIGPCVPGSAVGACGVGASGTAGCCWARTPAPKISPAPKPLPA